MSTESITTTDLDESALIPYMEAPNCVERSTFTDTQLRYALLPASIKQHIYVLEDRIAKQVELIEDGNSTVSQYRTQLIQSRDSHNTDIDTIGEMLIYEAEERDWCSMYDDFIKNVNERLSIKLPERERSFVVEISAIVRMQYEIDASSRDQAEECAREAVHELDGGEYNAVRVTDIYISDIEAQHSS